MINQIVLIAGAATQDEANPAQEDLQGIRFAADGNKHKCGWDIYIPTALRTAAPVTLRLTFYDGGLGVGTARLEIQYFGLGDNTAILTGGNFTTSVVIPNDPTKFVTVDLNIATWINANTTILLLSFSRDSSDPLDTFGGTLDFSVGRTLDT